MLGNGVNHKMQLLLVVVQAEEMVDVVSTELIQTKAINLLQMSILTFLPIITAHMVLEHTFMIMDSIML